MYQLIGFGTKALRASCHRNELRTCFKRRSQMHSGSIGRCFSYTATPRTRASIAVKPLRGWSKYQSIQHRNPITNQLAGARFFQTESDFHTAADETLEDIQDAVDETLEDAGIPEFEATFASGVLTLTFPPHGTWVINKQTPNRQLWWSSPISGPRRYEYENGEWVFTRDESHSMTLLQALQEEVQEIYQVDLEL